MLLLSREINFKIKLGFTQKTRLYGIDNFSGNSSPECPAGTAIKQMLQPEMKAERPDPCSAFLAPPDHCASLLINGDRILISSNNQDLVKTSKDVLQEFFAVMNEVCILSLTTFYI